MVAVTLAILHAIIRATWQVTAVGLVLFKQKEGGMHEDCVHLIIYIRRNKDMVKTIPLTLLAIRTLHPIKANGILTDIRETRLADAQQSG